MADVYFFTCLLAKFIKSLGMIEDEGTTIPTEDDRMATEYDLRLI